MILKAALAALVAALMALGVQTWRLDRCQARTANADACEEVSEIKNEVNHETDDDLADRISDPR